jgi:predicted O-methyltransferase YrrM
MEGIEVIAPAAYGGRSAVYRAARRVWQGGQLYRLLDAAARLPAPIGPRFTRARLRVKLWGGAHALVPERELRQAYTNALHTLLGRNGTPDSLGEYLEFGVYTGTSLACMHDASRAIGLSSMRLLGFDSFEGLPDNAAEDDDKQWKPGTFRSDLDLTRAELTKRGVDWERIELVPGWYDDTLTPETADRLGLRRASVVMIDCDNYSSAKRALTFCEPLIRHDAVFIFDDWNTRGLADQNLGEKRAFDELLADHPDLDASPLEAYSPTSAVFLVTRRS